MTHINAYLRSLSGLKAYTQTANNLSTASTRPEQNTVEKSVVFQRVSSLSTRQLVARDSNSALALIEGTDNALFRTTSVLLELRTLAQQAISQTLSSEQSRALVSRANTLKSSLDTIAKSSAVNGKNLLDGNTNQLDIPFGSQNSSLSIRSFKADSTALGSHPGFRQSTSDRVQLSDNVIGTQGIQEGNASALSITQFSLQIVTSGQASPINIAQSSFGGAIRTVAKTTQLTDRGQSDFSTGLAKSIAERINSIRLNQYQPLRNAFATALTQFKASDVSSDDFSGQVDASKGTSVASGVLKPLDLVINGVDIGDVIIASNDSSGSLVRAINDKNDITGVAALVDSSGQLQLSAFDGRDIVVSTASPKVNNTLFGAGDNRFSAGFNQLRISGRVTVSSDDVITFVGADIAKTGFDDLTLPDTNNNTLSNGTIFSVSIADKTSASNAITVIDMALSQVLAYRSELASALNSIISTTIDPFSRIRSAQEAASAAELISRQVKQRAGLTLSVQANSSTEQTLALLR